MAGRCISDRRPWAAGVAAFGAALLCVALLAAAQRTGWLDWLDSGVMRWVGDVRDGEVGGHVTTLMRLASAAGGTVPRLILAALFCAWLLAKGRGRVARWLALTVIGGTLLNPVLKRIFAAPRPDLLPHLDSVHSYSFPSGHAAGTLITLGAMAMVAARRDIYWAAALLALLVGVSRVWLGVHWPGDVLAGWVEAAGWLALCACWLPAGRGQH